MDTFNWDIASVAISGVALVVSVISWIQSAKAQKLQNKLNDLDYKLKQFELAEHEKEEAEKNQSCVEARVIKIAKNQYRMKIWNSGNTTVYNISAKIEENAGVFINDHSKMPFEQLEPQKSFEVVTIVYNAYGAKFHIITEWDDADGKHHEKDQMGDV